MGEAARRGTSLDPMLGRAIAYVLRHERGVVDASGWASIDTTLAALAARGRHITPDALCAYVAGDVRRFERVGDRIRARHGHSVPVLLDHPIAAPPASLFHGTVARFVASIRKVGLVRGRRNAVHLSSSRDAAMRVGSRRGTPICVEVRARAAHDDGIAFAKVGDGAIWLVAAVPPTYLVIPDR